jgi:hypothetical protein
MHFLFLGFWLQKCENENWDVLEEKLNIEKAEEWGKPNKTSYASLNTLFISCSLNF